MVSGFDAIVSNMHIYMIQGRFVTHVELEKPVSGGLGFSVVGLKSENHGELGIFIQEIQPGSVAHRFVETQHGHEDTERPRQ